MCDVSIQQGSSLIEGSQNFKDMEISRRYDEFNFPVSEQRIIELMIDSNCFKEC